MPSVSRLKLRQLSLVLKLVETGNLHDAASALHMSQPGASKLLQEIEDALGAALFVRHPRGMKPTPVGHMAARHAELILAELQKMQQGVDGLQSGITGYVTFGAVNGALPEIVAPALLKMAEENPTVEVSLHVATSDVLLREVKAGRLDFAVCGLAGAAGMETLGYSPLLDETPVVVAGPANPLLRRPNLALEDIHSERWILPPAGTPELRFIEDAFHAAGLPLPVNSIRAGSMFATAVLLGSTQMLAIVPRSIFRYFADCGQMGLIHAEIRANMEPYGVITASDRASNPAAIVLTELVREAALTAFRNNNS